MNHDIKYAIVTGGTKGIGKAVAKMLVRKNYHVVVTYKEDKSAVRIFKNELGKQANQIDFFQVNHGSQSDIISFCTQMKNMLPRLDTIVCNVGNTCRKKFLETMDEDFLELFQVSLMSHHTLIRELHHKIKNNSRIIFIGSLMAIEPHSMNIAYGVSKAAIHAYAVNLVKEFEGQETTVNVIAPGFVETDWQKEKPTYIRENIYSKTAIKRFAHPSEIANAVEFCINNAFVNGSVIEVSGGYSFK